MLRMRLGQVCQHVLNLKVSLRTSAFVVFGTFFHSFLVEECSFFFLDSHHGAVYVVAILHSDANLTGLRHPLIRTIRGLMFFSLTLWLT